MIVLKYEREVDLIMMKERKESRFYRLHYLPDIVRHALHQLVDQLIGLALDLGPGRGGAVTATSVSLTNRLQFY